MLDLARRERATRLDKAELPAGRAFVYREILARIGGDGNDVARQLFASDQSLQQLTGGSADRVDRQDLAIPAFEYARDIDATPAGVAAHRSASELLEGSDALHRGRKVQSGVERDRDDLTRIVHALRRLVRRVTQGRLDRLLPHRDRQGLHGRRSVRHAPTHQLTPSRPIAI